MNVLSDEPASRLSPITGVFVRAIEQYGQWPRRRAAVVVILLFAATAVLDDVASGLFNPHLSYFIAIFLTAWAFGEIAGLLAALIATLAITSVHGFAYGVQSAGSSPFVVAINCVGRSLMLSSIGLLTSALRHVVHREKMRASVDGLTGALTFAALQERLQLNGTPRRRSKTMVLAYVDIDSFKEINDRHGHSAGDHVLRTFVSAVQQWIGPSDRIARVGGDEFIVAMAAIDSQTAEQAAEMLHAHVSRVLAAGAPRASCSMGALVVPSHCVISGDALVQSADALMYEIKRSGKNACRIAYLDHSGIVLNRSSSTLVYGAFDDAPTAYQTIRTSQEVAA